MPITSPLRREDGDGAFRVMRNAIKDAKLDPITIDYINAHGTSTPVGDVIECTAIKRAFRRPRLLDCGQFHQVHDRPSPRRRRWAGSGLTVLAIRDQIAPPTINLDQADRELRSRFRSTCRARPMKIEYALSNSFGFGGTNG